MAFSCPSCRSKNTLFLTPKNLNLRMWRCLKCGHTWEQRKKSKMGGARKVTIYDGFGRPIASGLNKSARMSSLIGRKKIQKRRR